MADELRKQVFGFGEQHHVLLVAKPLHLRIEVRQEGETAIVLAQQVAGVPRTEVLRIEPAHVLQQRPELPDERLGRRTLGAPAVGRGAHLQHGGGGSFQFSGGHDIEPVGETAALARKIRGGKPCRADKLHGLRSRLLQLPLGGLGMGRSTVNDTPQLLLGPGSGERRAVLLLEKLAAQGENAVADVPFAPLVDTLLDETGHPAQQVAVGRDGLDKRIGALGEHRSGFDFDVVIEVDAQLLDESPQNALEKSVDGEDRETRIIVENPGPGLGRPLLHGAGVEPELPAQVGGIGTRPAGREQVYLLENTRLHLLGSLVGEGHGEDMAVERRLLHHVAHVLVGQLVGLARPGAGIEDSGPHGKRWMFGKRKSTKQIPNGKALFAIIFVI